MSNSNNTFFITGVQRSGTTLLSVILGNHPEIDIDGYATAFRLVTCFKDYAKSLPIHLKYEEDAVIKRAIAQDYRGRLAEFTDYKNFSKYGNVKQLFSEGVKSQLKQSQRTLWGDKTPNMQHYLGDLLMLVPNAKIIHIVRDGRATAYSHANRAHQHILLAAQDWMQGNIVALVNQKLLGEKQHLIIKYEDLLKSPKQTIQQVCHFLEIEFTPEMLQLEKGNTDNNYVKGTFDMSKIEAFKQQLTHKTLRKIEAIQAPLLHKLGYELENKNLINVYKPLSPFWVIFYRQIANFKSLFRSKRTAMINRKNVEIKVPFRSRWSKFLLLLGHDFLGKEVYFSLRDKKISQRQLFDNE